MSTNAGRLLLPGPTDQAAERRVPTQRLHLIPKAARASFVPWLDLLPGVRPGENDLTRVAPGRPRAQGEILALSGQVLDEYGRPVRNALVEIWNANKWGRYLHVRDPATEPLDPNFLGFGRAITDDRGFYSFKTVRPGAYLARSDIGRWRPAHVHFSIRGGSARLVTQMYFKGDPNLAGDPSFGLLGDARQRHFAEVAGKGPEDETIYRWNIVIGGRNANFFET